MKRDMKKIIIISIMFFLGSCSATKKVHTGTVQTAVSQQTINELQQDPVPGTHLQPWQETYYDYVSVPGAIDPKGLYYRSSHKTVYEIRPGKHQRVEYPEKICDLSLPCDDHVGGNHAVKSKVKAANNKVKR